jgi:hypothetical protein
VANIERSQSDEGDFTKMVECVTPLWGGFVEVACIRRLADHFCQVGYAQLMLGQAVDGPVIQGVTEPSPTYISGGSR